MKKKTIFTKQLHDPNTQRWLIGIVLGFVALALFVMLYQIGFDGTGLQTKIAVDHGYGYGYNVRQRCMREGQTVPLVPNAPQCCKGLTLLSPPNPNMLGIAGVCSRKCGNNRCDQLTETESNCPQDCQALPCLSEGETVPIIPNAPLCCKGLTLIKPLTTEPSIVGIQGTCTAKCGDRMCDPAREDSLNCPQDCKSTCVKAGQPVPVVANPPKCCQGLTLVKRTNQQLGVAGFCERVGR